MNRTLRWSARSARRSQDVRSVAGVFLVLLVMGALAQLTGHALIWTSLGASAAIVLADPLNTQARPHNVVTGHMLSALVGFAAVALVASPGMAVLAAAAAAALAVMLATGSLHPPGVGTALVIVTERPSLSFLVFPVLTGAVLIVAAARLWRLLDPDPVAEASVSDIPVAVPALELKLSGRPPAGPRQETSVN